MAQAEIYKWVDAQGNVHFGDKKPNSSQSETLSLPASKSSPTPSASENPNQQQRQKKLLQTLQEERELREKETKVSLEKQNKLKQDCAYWKDYLRNISSGRIYTLDNKGERVYANDQEHETQIKQVQQQIDQYCR
ncbi:uncharacterized protein DUF4124 [Agitococcus lubricus]|uniref:Uncharacterized protein DUF4124 n=2 Tax=Agitococcus lubricus TaxID=1077255 RepID=A0A2T5J3I6_9GAMM|nr:uncharacterized protein DUF4124 [Agitococcus lubricus]